MKKATSAAALLITQLEEACRRPLFVEIVSPNKSDANNNNRRKNPQEVSETALSEMEIASRTSSNNPSMGKRSRTDDKKQTRSWHELLAEAAELLPFMTDEEHGKVLRLASILLLGFLLPHSTGNDYFLLQNAPRYQSEDSTTNFDMDDYVLNMPLEERLAKSIMFYSANEYGEFDCLTDGTVELAFDTFLRDGLIPLLAGRPFHREQVDLLHILAMVIHPQPALELMIPETIRYLEKVDRPHWNRAKRLIQCHYANHFQIHYGHRVQIAQLLAEHIVLPVLDETSHDVVGPMFHGAIPHLRCSLRTLAQGGLSHWDTHVAHCGLVSIAYQIRNKRILRGDWDYLLHLTVDDRSNYGCTDCHRRGAQLEGRHSLLVPKDESKFCPHAARGHLLAEFLLRSCQSRRDTVGGFLQHAASSLSDAIEWQLDCWTRPSEDEKDDAHKKMHAPCLLASLLYAGRHLFYLLPPSNDENGDESKATLIESAIQLLRHSDVGVMKEAAGLLVNAFSYSSEDDIKKYAHALFETIKVLLPKETDADSMLEVEKTVGVVAQKSPAFASSLYKHILDNLSNTEIQPYIHYRLIAMLSINSPGLASKESQRLLSLLKERAASPVMVEDGHLIASILSCRQSRYFASEGKKLEGAVRELLLQNPDRWSQYKMARHGLVTGNFGLAGDLFDCLVASPLSEKHYLWMSALKQVAAAESTLSKDAAKGIPTATTKLRSALSYIQSLDAFADKATEGYAFQARFLLMRLDFLDLITILRQLTREMRLTGSGPAKNTRSYQILQNTVRSLVVLSSRYSELSQQHGLLFACRRSQDCLRVLQGLALFLALAARTVFSDVLPAWSSKASIGTFLGDSNYSMARMMRRIDEAVIQPMDSSMDPLIRAAAMLEVLDGILMVPIPFPRDFLVPRPQLSASLRLLADPKQTGECVSASLDTIEASPSVCFTFFVSGYIPDILLAQSRLPFSTVILWYHIIYDGPLTEEEAPVDEKQEDEDGVEVAAVVPRETILSKLPDLSSFSPVSSRLFSGGRFYIEVECPCLLDEGCFRVEVRLGCRDVSGAEWEIPVTNKRDIPVRVSRSN